MNNTSLQSHPPVAHLSKVVFTKRLKYIVMLSGMLYEKDVFAQLSQMFAETYNLLCVLCLYLCGTFTCMYTYPVSLNISINLLKNPLATLSAILPYSMFTLQSHNRPLGPTFIPH